MHIELSSVEVKFAEWATHSTAFEFMIRQVHHRKYHMTVLAFGSFRTAILLMSGEVWPWEMNPAERANYTTASLFVSIYVLHG